MNKCKKIIYYATLIITIIYLLYRIFFTLPNKLDISMLFAIIVLLIELIDAVFYVVYTLNVLVKDNEILKKPKLLKKDYPEIDVYIATLNEDIDIINNTIIACKRMKYPNKDKVHIYLCDDGNRTEMKELCTKLKVNYITRKETIGAKAGNYNHALKNTNSPYIVVFDADMKPNPDFLIKTVPYLFADDNVGFVQLPQKFYNLDIFQRRFKLWKYIPFEQDYFYHRIQIARNQTNSVVFCGTNAVLSRKALEEIDGFATNTITEDFATGLLMESRGYKGIALPFDEVYGKNVESVPSLIKQRIRWCRGCIQTFKNYKIINNKDLTLEQEADYLSGIYYWFYGFRSIIYFLVPLLYSFFNIKIIQGNLLIFSIFFFIQYVLKRFVIDKLEERKVSATWNRIYETILSPIMFVEAFLELVGISKKSFEVTEKNKEKKISFKFVYMTIVHILLLGLNVLGLYVSLKKRFRKRLD